MSKIIKLFSLALLLVMFCFECAFAATYPCDGQVLKNAVNVRKKASQGSDQVGKLKRDEIVTVVGEETNGDTVWYEIEFGNGKSGYVRGDLIKLNESVENNNTVAAQPAQTSQPVTKEQTISGTASLMVGDRFFMGEWEQDNKKSNGGEPIEWQVLAAEGNRLLIITVCGIDTVSYGEPRDSKLSWETSTLRKWMNEEFYSSAFSKEEKAAIMGTSVDGSNIKDYIFCLSMAEARKYFSNAAAMSCKPTSYAKSTIGKTNALDNSGYGIWWLRDLTGTYPSTTTNEVAYVNMRKGIVSKDGMWPLYDDGILARPAMWILRDTPQEEVELLNKLATPTLVTTPETSIFEGQVKPKTYYFGDYSYTLLGNGGVEIVSYNGNAKELVIPEVLDGYVVMSIGDKAFYGSDATSIFIPYSVTSIGQDPFSYCKNLTSIRVSSENPMFESINGVLYEKGKNTLWACPCAIKGSSFTIPQGVVSIGDYAFQYCENLIEICIPNSVKSIGEGAFKQCKNLTSINIPDGITEIKNGVFNACSKLTNITIPESVELIGDGAFSASGLTSITIPDSVVSISRNPFDSCKKLTNIRVSPQHPVFATIDGVLYNKIEKMLICCPNGMKTNEFAIPEGIVSIGDYAFYNNWDLTGIIIPEGVTTIGEYAFWGSHLQELELPQSIISIEKDAFTACKQLTTVTIGASLIGEEAFESCDRLKEVILLEGVEVIENGVFAACSTLRSVTIPSSVTTIKGNPFSNCQELTSVQVSRNNPTFATIGGVLYNMAEKKLIHYPTAFSSDSFTIPQGVLTVGERAFCNNDFLTSITIPDSVTAILEEGFDGCGSINSIVIPSSVTIIGESAFDYCGSLVSVSISEGTVFIGRAAFDDCKSLVSITIPESVTFMGDDAIGKNNALKASVSWNSYAAEWCEANDINFIYPDNTDWLNN